MFELVEGGFQDLADPLALAPAGQGLLERAEGLGLTDLAEQPGGPEAGRPGGARQGLHERSRRAAAEVQEGVLGALTDTPVPVGHGLEQGQDGPRVEEPAQDAGRLAADLPGTILEP